MYDLLINRIVDLLDGYFLHAAVAQGSDVDSSVAVFLF